MAFEQNTGGTYHAGEQDRARLQGKYVGGKHQLVETHQKDECDHGPGGHHVGAYLPISVDKQRDNERDDGSGDKRENPVGDSEPVEVKVAGDIAHEVDDVGDGAFGALVQPEIADVSRFIKNEYAQRRQNAGGEQHAYDEKPQQSVAEDAHIRGE